MRKVWPSEVVSPIARTSCVATCSARSNARRTGSVEHEQHVDVGCVRQLAPTEPAHPDHRERQLGLERLQRGLEGRVGEMRQLVAHGREVGEPEDVAGADAKQLAALEPPETVATGAVVLAPIERAERILDELGRAWVRWRARRRRRGRRGSPVGGASRDRARDSNRGCGSCAPRPPVFRGRFEPRPTSACSPR